MHGRGASAPRSIEKWRPTTVGRNGDATGQTSGTGDSTAMTGLILETPSRLLRRIDALDDDDIHVFATSRTRL